MTDAPERDAAASEPAEEPTDAVHAEKMARALTSPLRMRVLRLCRFDARTNKELAELLDVNPGTMLHHVRTLVDAGLLVPGPERTGTRGAREVPYRSTGLSWRARSTPNLSIVLLETMWQQLEGVDPEDVDVGWLGLRLNADHRRELERRTRELLEEFMQREPDPDGDAYSLVIVTHPDNNPPAREMTENR